MFGINRPTLALEPALLFWASVEPIESILIRPATKFVLHVIGATVGAAAILFAVALWRLSAGPVSLAFLAPYVEDALGAEDASFRVSFDDFILSWAGWERSLDIRAVGVQAFSADGHVLARVPEMSLVLSLPGLARGLIAPTHLYLYRPELRLTRHAEGDIDMAIGGETATDGDLAARLLADLLAPPDRNRELGYLRRITVLGARLVVVDEVLGTEWEAPNADIELERHESGLRIESDLALTVDGATLDVTARASYETAGRKVALAVAFDEIDSARLTAVLAHFAPELAAQVDAALPVSGRFALSGDLDGRIDEFTFELSGGAGTVTPPLSKAAEPFEVRSMHLRGAVDFGGPALRIDELFVDFGGPTFTGTALLSGDPASPDLVGEFTMTDVTAGDLGRFWPAEVAPGGRRWVIAHITDGIVPKLSMRLDVSGEDWSKRHLDRDSVSGTFEVRGGRAEYIGGLPPVENLAGTGRFDAIDVHLNLTHGTIEGLTLERGTVDLLDLDRAGEIGKVEVSVSGPLESALVILAMPGLGLAQEMGIDPSRVGGHINADLRIEMPLSDDLVIDDVIVRFGADLRDVSISSDALPSVFNNRGVSDGNLAAMMDSETFYLSGDVVVGDTPLEITWQHNFKSPPAEFRRRIDVTGRLNEDDRAAFGIDDSRLSGVLDFELHLVDRDGSSISGDVIVDLSPAVLDVPALAWSKPPGAPGRARLGFELAPDGDLRGGIAFAVEAEGLTAAGIAEMTPSRDGLAAITFHRLDSGLNQGMATITFNADGGYDVRLAAESLDLRPHQKAWGESDDADWPPIKISGVADTIILEGDATMHDIDGEVTVRDGRIESARIEGFVSDGDPFTFRLGRIAGKREFLLSSENAGAVFKALGVYDRMSGGRLLATGVIHDDRPDGATEGTVVVDGFHVVDAPLLAKMLTIATVTGALEMLDGKGLPFGHLEAPFVYRDQLLTLTDVRASGLSVGFTLDGTVDLGDDAQPVDFSGTIIPAYAINSALGHIPLLGKILTGGEGEGMFAATYRVEGPMDDTRVSVNPLAVLAPGILRQLFTIFESSGEAAPANGATPHGPAANGEAVPQTIR